MSEAAERSWVKLLFSGIGVAAFTFAAPIVWQKISYRPVGPAYVAAALRVDDGALLLLVRNNSQEPLDLVEADIDIDGIPRAPQEFGAYPVPSHLYAVDSKSSAHLAQSDGRLSVKLRIAQTIEPGQADEFGFKINGPSGLLTPTRGSLTGKITDSRGNNYRLSY